jgi:toxin-antitoxin system PIN domain toxin
MILLDANLLIYAIDSTSPHHTRARRWLEKVLSGDTAVGLPWAVVLAFLRITTRAGILERQLPVDRAVAFVDEWLDQPYVELVGPGAAHWPLLKNLLHEAGAAGNLTTDAHLAALAIESGCELASTDNDFRRFAGLRLVNPLVEGTE